MSGSKTPLFILCVFISLDVLDEQFGKVFVKVPFCLRGVEELRTFLFMLSLNHVRKQFYSGLSQDKEVEGDLVRTPDPVS